MYWYELSLLSLLTATATAQSVQPPGAIVPVAEDCGGNASVVCIKGNAAVLPYPFQLNVTTNEAQTDFRNTSVPSDPSFDLVANADFVVFDRAQGLEYLGSNPTIEYIFSVNDFVHEAPVYIPSQNLLYLSQLGPIGILSQLIVDLNNDPPTLSNFTSNPPVYLPNGGTYYNGSVLWAAAGGSESVGGMEQLPSITVLDPASNQTTVLLNNYFGSYFNGPDDIAVHPVTGDVFFTDPGYSWYNNRTDTAPQLPPAIWRFNPASGAVHLVDDTLQAPNGIAITPDGSTLYISETAAEIGSLSPADRGAGSTYNTTRPRTVYAYDVTNNGTRISNKRAFYLAPSFVPDGLKVSREGLVLTGAGRGVDVLDQQGRIIIRVQANYTVVNFAWVGDDLREFWLVGQGGISRVRWNIQGPMLT